MLGARKATSWMPRSAKPLFHRVGEIQVKCVWCPNCEFEWIWSWIHHRMKFIEDWKDQFDTKEEFWKMYESLCELIEYIQLSYQPTSSHHQMLVWCNELLALNSLRTRSKTSGGKEKHWAPKASTSSKDPLDGPSAMFEKELTLEIQERNSSLCSRSRKR